MAALVIHLMASITNVSASQVSEVLSVKRKSILTLVHVIVSLVLMAASVMNSNQALNASVLKVFIVFIVKLI